MQDLDPIDQIYQGNLIFSGLDMPERIKPIYSTNTMSAGTSRTHTRTETHK
jgi:hypothetical protein